MARRDLEQGGEEVRHQVATDADGLVFALIRLFCVNLRPVEAFKTFLDTD